MTRVEEAQANLERAAFFLRDALFWFSTAKTIPAESLVATAAQALQSGGPLLRRADEVVTALGELEAARRIEAATRP